ncbi:efflux transporter outer membrane subunit [Sphingomonas sp. ID0503]|uniref:efflux transporter outer membrane subunit n=1 Tax=Sphingomonas sp. ID0503 TaxID=3399691 RepID=UPI003AFAB9B3
MKAPRLVAAVVLAALGGCAVGPNYVAPPSDQLVGPAWDAGLVGAPQEVDLADWWESFDDPLLSDLIARAAGGNLDIAVAVARLRQAREAMVQARAGLFPSLSVSGGVTRNFTEGSRSNNVIIGGGTGGGSGIIVDTGGSGNTRLNLNANASWQADILGGTRRSIEAARADRDAAAFDLADVRTSIAAEVATNYIQARLGQARLAIAEGTLKTQDDNLQIARWRVQAGLVSSVDAEQARTQRAQTAASIPTLRTNYLNAINRLGVLTGALPGTVRPEMEAARPVPVGPDAIAVGIPADTLRQRPDVRSAERQLVAATARIGVAKAQLFPALNITGNVGTSALSLGSLGDIITGSLFAGLTQSIFQAGRLGAQVRSQRAAADAAFATYKSTVLTGLEEVENALIAVEAAKSRQQEQAIATDAAGNAAFYARSQYQAGLADFQTLLESERSLLSARDSLASAQADQSLALVQLYLALGGGWRPDAPLETGNSR